MELGKSWMVLKNFREVRTGVGGMFLCFLSMLLVFSPH